MRRIAIEQVLNVFICFKKQKGRERIGQPKNWGNNHLLVFDCLCDDFSIEMIVQTMIKMALDGQRLVQKLLEHVLLCRLAEQYTLGVVVGVGPTSAPNHLHDICDGVIVVGVILASVVLGIHDHHKMTVDVQGPAERPGNHNNLYGATLKQRLDDGLVRRAESFVNVPKGEESYLHRHSCKERCSDWKNREEVHYVDAQRPILSIEAV